MKRILIIVSMIIHLSVLSTNAGNRPSIVLEGKEVSLGDTRVHVKSMFKDVCNVNDGDDIISLRSSGPGKSGDIMQLSSGAKFCYHLTYPFKVCICSSVLTQASPGINGASTCNT